MKLISGAPKPSPRYAKLAHDLRESNVWVENDDFELLDAIRDLCEFAYQGHGQTDQRVDAVIAALYHAMDK
jgi:hypothetical protein